MAPEAVHAGNLLLHVIVLAIHDDEVAFILGPVCAGYMRLLGFNDHQIFLARQRFLRGQIQSGELFAPVFDRLRRGYRRPEDPVHWAQWCRIAPT